LTFDEIVARGDEPIQNHTHRQYGIRIRAIVNPIEYITIKNSQITNNNLHGIFLNGKTYHVEIGPNNNISYNGWGLGSTENPVYAHGIEIHPPWGHYDQEHGARDVKIFDNKIDHNDMQGIRPAFCQKILIRNNHLHDNGATSIQLENHVDYAVVEDNLAEYNAQVYNSETGVWLDDSNHVVVQGNVFRNNKFGFRTQGTNQIIFRNNLLYENNRGPDDYSDFNYQALSIYLSWGNNDNILVHNTLYNNCDPENQQYHEGVHGDLTIARKDNEGHIARRPIFKNNIISESKCRYDLWVGSLVTEYKADYNNYYRSQPKSLPVNWRGTPVSWLEYTSPVNKGGIGQDLHSITQNPLFFDGPNHNFHLQSNSPNIDAGGFLTQTINSGTGTNIQVADARYFTDGMGLTDGDLIKVGSNDLAKVVSVNYGTNTIKVDNSISWDNGDPVSYPYSGMAPDIGAFEYQQQITLKQLLSSWLTSTFDQNGDNQVNSLDWASLTNVI
jgi:parallel beta-helix repeat protein